MTSLPSSYYPTQTTHICISFFILFALLFISLYILLYPAIICSRHGDEQNSHETQLPTTNTNNTTKQVLQGKFLLCVSVYNAILKSFLAHKTCTHAYSDLNPTMTTTTVLHNLSLIIPAYNEEQRLPIMLNQTLLYLKENQTLINHTIQKNSITPSPTTKSIASFEVIIVDDGSTDNTCQIVKQYASKWNDNNTLVKLRLIQMKVNSGKGAAIRTGMLCSKSHYCLMVDADGATDITCLIKLVTKMMDSSAQNTTNNGIVVIGSRAHLEEESTIQRSQIRTFLMQSFHFFVKHLCSNKIRDTQCGFKLFNRYATIKLFTHLHLRRWAFDIEVVSLAERLGFELVEVGVKWKEIDGSKLETGKFGLAMVSLGMLRDMICVRICYGLGIWRLKQC